MDEYVNHSVRRLSLLAKINNAKSYLEIGVRNGITFLNVPVRKKVAVDPHYRFDYEAVISDDVKCHVMTSDRYFTCVDEGKEKYDLIYLDGLHTFQQTLRDFCCSISVASEKAIWLIDDTLPRDAYSAWPNQSESIKYRRKSGLQGNIWHGDVFKTVVAINDLFPLFCFITIEGNGNPQTIVWRGRRDAFSPLYDNMELISRMSYFDLQNSISVMNITSESKAIQLVKESFDTSSSV
jgi:hypothetical protein